MNINKKRLIRKIVSKYKAVSSMVKGQAKRAESSLRGKFKELSFKSILIFLMEQIKIRPRARFSSKLIVGLILVFIAAANFASFTKEKESEIIINGQAVLVAQKIEVKPSSEPEISQSVVAKDAPFIFANPVNGGYLSQGFSSYHRAFDIATDLHAEVKPLGFGIVEYAGYTTDGKGLIVIVDHGEGVKSLYAHLGRAYVKQGEMVNPASVVGSIGMTGRSTGPHVHLEIYDGGVAVNPSNLLPSEQLPLLYSR